MPSSFSCSHQWQSSAFTIQALIWLLYSGRGRRVKQFSVTFKHRGLNLWLHLTSEGVFVSARSATDKLAGWHLGHGAFIFSIQTDEWRSSFQFKITQKSCPYCRHGRVLDLTAILLGHSPCLQYTVGNRFPIQIMESLISGLKSVSQKFGNVPLLSANNPPQKGEQNKLHTLTNPPQINLNANSPIWGRNLTLSSQPAMGNGYLKLLYMYYIFIESGCFQFVQFVCWYTFLNM